MLEKVLKDFEAKGVAIDAVGVRREMERLWTEAKRQIMGE